MAVVEVVWSDGRLMHRSLNSRRNYSRPQILQLRNYTSKPIKPLAYDAKPTVKYSAQATSLPSRRWSAVAQPPGTLRLPEREKTKGVLSSRTQIAIGVVLCGSIIYSMVDAPTDSTLSLSSPTYMPARRPPPT